MKVLSVMAILMAGTCVNTVAHAQSRSEVQNPGEIIVTAQKREERLKDVPVPVSAVTGSALLERNQSKAEDFFSSIPGVNLQVTRNRSNLAIRGITTGPTTGNPIVGYTVDDISFGSSTGQGGLFGGAPDLDPSELARVEVLRGPQGTLYGASSMGGLVKYVTVDPSMDKIYGTVAAGLSTVKYGSRAGYNGRASLNIPVSEMVAVRVGGFTREDPGYIDNVNTGKKDVNKSRVRGGRVSALWKPADGFSAKLAAVYQKRESFGSANVDATLGGDFLQSDHVGTGPSKMINQMYSAVLNGDVGGIKITSLTAYSISDGADTSDFSATSMNTLWPGFYPNAGVSRWASPQSSNFDVNKFSQELRAAIPLGSSVDLTLGGLYTHDAMKYDIVFAAADAVTGKIIDNASVWRDNGTFKEYAAFANLLIRLSDRFDVQGGLRYSKNRQTLHHREWGVMSPNGFKEAQLKSQGDSLTFQFTPRFKISSDHMVYGRVATGYRPGGPNAACSRLIPCEYAADSTTNFEIGAKGDLFHRMLSYDVSLYTIDWKNLQVTRLGPKEEAYGYTTNAGRARSRGIEASLESQPTDGLTIGIWGAYTQAEIRKAFAPDIAVYAQVGDALPYSSRYSGRLSANYEAPLGDDLTGSIGGSLTYVGRRQGEFVNIPADADRRQVYPEYVQFDLNAGLTYDSWKMNIFVQNVTNKKGVLGGGFNNGYNGNANWFNYIQPRTAGISIEKSF